MSINSHQYLRICGWMRSSSLANGWIDPCPPPEWAEWPHATEAQAVAIQRERDRQRMAFVESDPEERIGLTAAGWAAAECVELRKQVERLGFAQQLLGFSVALGAMLRERDRQELQRRIEQLERNGTVLRAALDLICNGCLQLKHEVGTIKAELAQLRGGRDGLRQLVAENAVRFILSQRVADGAHDK